MTSGAPNEGKTTIAIGLARTFARGQSRVLLIDGDLRKNGVSNLLGLRGKHGFEAFLNKQVNLSEAIVPMPELGIDVLPSSKGDVGPSDLLDISKMAECMEECRRRYDFIIVDSPPVLAVSDALYILPHADTALFLVRWNVARSRQVEEAMEEIPEELSHKMRFVLARGKVSRNRRAAYKYYYS